MFYSNNPLIKHKTGLLNLAEELGNISQACKAMGMSRDTFYRYQQAVEQGGVEALLNQTRQVPNIKNRVDEHIEQAVVKFALDFPALATLQADLDEWLLCPVCGSKTRNKIRKDTVLENYPLYCPKCRNVC